MFLSAGLLSLCHRAYLCLASSVTLFLGSGPGDIRHTCPSPSSPLNLDMEMVSVLQSSSLIVIMLVQHKLWARLTETVLFKFEIVKKGSFLSATVRYEFV